MKKKITQYNKILFCILFLAITFFSDIWYGIFTVQDALVHYVWAQTGDFIKSSVSIAVGQSRIMYFVCNLCSLIPYYFDNLTIYNLFSFTTIIICAYSIWRLLSRHWSKEAGFLGILLYFAFAQADWSHNFFVSYIVVLQGIIAFCLFSIERLLTYFKDKQKKYLIQSALFLVLASSVYESFILYSILIFFIALRENYSTGANLKKLLKIVFIELRFHILFMILYLVIYFTFRIVHPSQYEANTVGNLDLAMALKTTLIYSVGMFPGAHFLRIFKEGVNVFRLTEMLDIIKMIVTGTIYIWLIKKSTIVSKGKQVCYLLLMILGTILPCVLYGFTKRHVEWVNNGTKSYGASYYSYYFWILAITIFCIWFYHRTKHKRVFLFLSAGVVMAVSFMTGISNHYFENYFKENFDRYCTFRQILQSDLFGEIDQNAEIYVEGSSGIHGNFDYVNLLAQKYTGRSYKFVTEYERVDFSGQVFMIKKIDGAWVFGKIDSDLTTDRACIFMEKNSAEYSLIGRLESGQALYVDGQNTGYYDGTFVVSRSDDNDNIALLEGKSIKMDSLQVVNQVLKNNPQVTFLPQEGFYGKEGNFWWTMNQSVVNIQAVHPMKILLSMEMLSAVDTANLVITTADQSYQYVIEPAETKTELELTLHEGDNFIQFHSDGEILSSKEDPREKVIRIFEPDIRILE